MDHCSLCASIAFFPVSWKLSKMLDWPFPEYWGKLAAHPSSCLNSFWLSFTQKRKKCVISKLFIFLLSQTQFQLRRASNISVVGDFWGLKGQCLVGKNIVLGHFLYRPPPRKMKKNVDMKHNPSVCPICRVVIQAGPAPGLYCHSSLFFESGTLSYVIPWEMCTFHFAVLSTMAALPSG